MATLSKQPTILQFQFYTVMNTVNVDLIRSAISDLVTSKTMLQIIDGVSSATVIRPISEIPEAKELYDLLGKVRYWEPK